MQIDSKKNVHQSSHNDLTSHKASEEEEILTSRFEKSSANKNMLKDDRDIKKQFESWRVEKSHNKSMLVKVKSKLRKLKRECKNKPKPIIKKINYLLRLTNEQLKYSRSISIPKLRRNLELMGSNTVVNSNTDEDSQMKCNPDTFRKLDSDRGYESQGVNFITPELGIACFDNFKLPNNKKSSLIELDKFKSGMNKFNLPLHLLSKNSHQLSLIQNSTANTNRSEKGTSFLITLYRYTCFKIPRWTVKPYL